MKRDLMRNLVVFSRYCVVLNGIKSRKLLIINGLYLFAVFQAVLAQCMG